jgi:hypothetical protein
MFTFFVIPPEKRKVLITLSHDLLILGIVIQRNAIKRIFLNVGSCFRMTGKIIPTSRTIAAILAQDK